FERWADRQRKRLGRAYADALEALASAAEASGHARDAVRWWRRRAGHDRFDARVTVRLMQALEAAGNRARALEVADVHAALLREEFGAEPDPEVSGLAERLRGQPSGSARPERSPSPSAADVSQPAGGAVDPEATAVEGSTESRPGPASLRGREADGAGPRWRRLLAGLARAPRRVGGVVIGVVALSTALWLAWPRASPPEGSIAVLPFANLASAVDGDYFADGVTEEIITHLSAVQGLKVISRTSAMRYRGTDKPIEEIAGELGVAHVLEGSVRRADGTVRIAAQLIEAGSGFHRWSSTYEGELIDILGLQERIARDVAEELEVELSSRNEVVARRRGTRDPEALELFLRGRYHWVLRTPEGHERARDYFEQAIDRDSAYADPYAGLAYTYLTAKQLGFSTIADTVLYARIKWAAEKAIALDEGSPDAHAALAVAFWWQRNWPGAEREFLRALELNPGHSTARTWYTLLLLGWGRTEEALRHARRAYEVDPFAVVTSGNLAHALYQSRRYERAIEQARKTMELDAAWGPRMAALAHVQLGEVEPAIRVMAARFGLTPNELRRQAAELRDPAAAPAHLGGGNLLADLAYVLAAAGEGDDAVVLLRRAREQEPDPFRIGRAFVALEEPDSALAWLEGGPWEWPHRANRFDPALDPLRDDPRFEELSARVERGLGIR
ncbi:MAG: BTAD domain-containing putative transcriptional regulator, partial [Acidobacteriota bacterium]